MDRESEYFEKELSRNKLDKAHYGLIQMIRQEVDNPDLSVTDILTQAYKASEFRYKNVQPRRLANYLSIRSLLLDSDSKYAHRSVQKADNQMLGERSKG